MDCFVDKFISQFNIWRPDQCYLGYVQLDFQYIQIQIHVDTLS